MFSLGDIFFCDIPEIRQFRNTIDDNLWSVISLDSAINTNPPSAGFIISITVRMYMYGHIVFMDNELNCMTTRPVIDKLQGAILDFRVRHLYPEYVVELRCINFAHDNG